MLLASEKLETVAEKMDLRNLWEVLVRRRRETGAFLCTVTGLTAGSQLP